MSVGLKRAYDEPSREDGIRVLVDRMWPRGLRKEEGAFDEWVKEIAPSAELRKWFGHDPARWSEFKRRYQRELERDHPEELQRLRELARRRRVTLVFAAKDPEHNNAVALRELLLH